jgi:ATP-dependent RNA helicase DDX54/DBP10
MGFEVQMQEILSRLPSTRQTLLFSATLPKSLVEFAKAGLVNPKLIRLDAESKISSDLQMAFFSIKPNEKEAALLALLRDVIKTPLAKDGIVDFDDSADMPGSDDDDDDMKGGAGKRKGFGYKGKRGVKHINEVAAHQAIIFTATKHHVEYITTLLKTAGYSASHIYGSLDQMARRQQMDRFKRGQTNLLVVTDVAARGIDIPVLENVINYDFPSGSRVFVHRVGRTARAGRKGWAWSFVTNTELPYLLDLQLFLGRPLVSSKTYTPAPDAFSSSLVLGTMPRESLDANVEYVATSLTESQPQLPILKEVTRKSQMMYERSQGKASQESYRRAKAMTKDESWQLAGNVLEDAANHPVYAEIGASVGYTDPQAKGDSAEAKASLLAQINSYQPSETIFEIGSRGKTPGAEIMRQRRSLHDKIKRKRSAQSAEDRNGGEPDIDRGDMDVDDDENAGERPEVEMADESDIEVG